MEGVTTAIVGFIFVCLVYPRLVKHKPQFYSAIGLLLLIILFDAIAHMDAKENGGGGLMRVMYVLTALLQIVTIVTLVLCVGGLTVRDLAGEVANTVEVIRRGETKPVLVPLRGEQPRQKEEAPAVPVEPVVPPPPAVAKDDSPIPLE
jgi:hypothetical protein